MWTRQGRRRPLGRAALVVATAAACAYFGHHAVTGEHGWPERVASMEKRESVRAELAALTERRQRLERRTALLDGTVIERDAVDERARDLLGVAREDEIVVLLHAS